MEMVEDQFQIVFLTKKNKMINIFKRFNCNKRILQLELTIEHQQSQMDDLRKIVLELSAQINSLQVEINHLVNKTKGSI